MRKALIFGFLCFSLFGSAQQLLTGNCIELQAGGDTLRLPGVALFGTSKQPITVSDDAGKFLWPADSLLRGISYAGYRLIKTLKRSNQLWVVLETSVTNLNEVQIVYERADIELNTLSVQKTERMGTQYLIKAACCNLSESFETNPSIDVNFTDALTGAKQIQMLGLSGPYALITKENMPYLRGLSGTYGLTHIPGTWIHSIQMGKGAGSVLNGFDSFTGQINTELYAPETAPPFLWNTYVNENLRNEYNLVLKPQKTSLPMVLLAHVSVNPLQQDKNQDQFVDIPIGEQIQLMPKFSFQKGGFEMQWGAGMLQDQKQAGQLQNVFNSPQQPYLIDIKQNKQEVFAKAGYVFLNRPGHSIGSQFSYSNFNIDLKNGLHKYNGKQSTLYLNLIYQGIFKTTAHTYKAGFSHLQNSITEFYIADFSRWESVPGVFAEYQYSPSSVFSMIAGMRSDFHNWFGRQWSPRLHIRYQATPAWTFRASMGRAFKSPYIFSEQMGYFSSARQWAINTIPLTSWSSSSYSVPYGLNPEQAWNMGCNAQYLTRWFDREASGSLEIYNTKFEQQLIPDVFSNPGQINFYNAKGGRATTIQAEMRCEPKKRWHLMYAYRFVENLAPFNGQMRDWPFISKHRAFFNTRYETRLKHWLLDATLQWHGTKKIPDLAGTVSNSPDFVIILSQITYQWFVHQHETAVYLGVENLTNVRQHPAVWAFDQPFGNQMDANRVWGPIYGRMLYFGFRYKYRS